VKFVSRTTLAAGLAWLAIAAPLAAAAGDGRAATAIRSGSAAFLKAYNAGDADAVLTHFEEGAVVMPPGALTVRGRAEIRQFVEKSIAGAKANGITLALGSGDDVGVSGDLGWHAGPFSVTKRSGAMIDTGTYLETWHKSGGHWRMIRRIWNSNAPTAATAPAVVPTPAPK
jgi:ketosteroid isomerase-like protein